MPRDRRAASSFTFRAMRALCLHGFHAPVVVQSAIMESGRMRAVSPAVQWAWAV